jgi:hypothetical protein
VPAGDAVSDVAAALPLFNKDIASIHMARSGELTIVFSSSEVITVPVNDAYENWEIALDDGEQWGSSRWRRERR